MKREKKKLPGTYPQFAFRITPEDKIRISVLIEEVKEQYNKDRAEDEKIINKNDIIVEALKKGLAILKKSKKG